MTTPAVHSLLDKPAKYHFDCCGKRKKNDSKTFYNSFTEGRRLLLSQVTGSLGHKAEQFCSNHLSAIDLPVVTQQVIHTKNFRDICHKLDTQTTFSPQQVKLSAE